MKHNHPEAFRLMEYVSEDDTEREVLWNSRDGVTPFIISSPTSGVELIHKNWKADRYAPNHVPKVGDRIFVDLTLQRARVFAARQVEQMLADPDPQRRQRLEERYASREEAVEHKTNEMLAYGGGGAPDVLIVTAGYLDELWQARMQPAESGVIVAGGIRDSVVKVTFSLEGDTLKIEQTTELMRTMIDKFGRDPMAPESPSGKSS